MCRVSPLSALLAVGPLLLFWLLAMTLAESSRLAAIRAFTWFALASLAGTEGLSVLGAISEISIQLYWAILGAGCAVILGYRLQQGHWISWSTLRISFSGFHELWIGLILLVTFFIARTVVPNSWDSMTYHLPRIEHWLQNGSLAIY